MNDKKCPHSSDGKHNYAFFITADYKQGCLFCTHCADVQELKMWQLPSSAK